MSNDELQKAIDDITNSDSASDNNTTNVADVSGIASVPLPDDLASDSSTNMNFMETPDANAGASAELFGTPPVPNTATAMPVDMGAPEASLSNDPVAGFNPNMVNLNITEPINNNSEPAQDLSAVSDYPAATATTNISAPGLVINGGEAQKGDLEAVKTAALLELYPLLPTMNINPRQKYDICMTVIDKTKDKGATSVALDAAKAIPDANEKGECLMKLVEAINAL